MCDQPLAYTCVLYVQATNQTELKRVQKQVQHKEAELQKVQHALKQQQEKEWTLTKSITTAERRLQVTLEIFLWVCLLCAHCGVSEGTHQ